MRRLSRCGPLPLIFLVSGILLLFQGCARPILQTYPAADHEIQETTAAFARYREISLEQCGCCLDAEADASVSVAGWFSDHTGKLSGYLQAMKPGYIKFVALNPLGQPIYILATNGSVFQSLIVPERKAYIGSVYSDTFQKFSPPGFAPEFSYYWLTGRLQPEELQVMAVRHDRELPAYWLQIRHAESGNDSMVLFDPEELIVLRHILIDEKGHHLVDVLYGEYQPEARQQKQLEAGAHNAAPGSNADAGACRIPGRILVSAKSDAQRMEIRLNSFLAGVELSSADFYLEVPDNFEQLLVK